MSGIIAMRWYDGYLTFIFLQHIRFHAIIHTNYTSMTSNHENEKKKHKRENGKPQSDFFIKLFNERQQN